MKTGTYLAPQISVTTELPRGFSEKDIENLQWALDFMTKYENGRHFKNRKTINRNSGDT